MKRSIIFVGLDAHKDSNDITLADDVAGSAEISGSVGRLGRTK
jgi:hypothetical protein